MGGWWRKLVFPVRRVWFAVSARVKARNHGGGLLKLHDDIQTCGYEDVQVMWEMLRRTESSEFISEPNNQKPQRPFWRNFFGQVELLILNVPQLMIWLQLWKNFVLFQNLIWMNQESASAQGQHMRILQLKMRLIFYDSMRFSPVQLNYASEKPECTRETSELADNAEGFRAVVEALHYCPHIVWSVGGKQQLCSVGLGRRRGSAWAAVAAIWKRKR
nr:MAGUK P55 subfamily member 4 like [Ipomoea batatas]